MAKIRARRRRTLALLTALAVSLCTLAACDTSPETGADTSAPAAPSDSEADALPSWTAGDASKSEHVVIAAGDIGVCDGDDDEKTASLIDDIDGTVVPLGDLAYSEGSAEQFAECYGTTWGRHKDRTLPVPGNHEYDTPNADGYFGYFGAAAGDPKEGYYSSDLGAWHLVVLNSNCEEVGGCDQGSPQAEWLREDLAVSSAPCTIAFWHHPRFSSGEHGSSEDTAAFWQALYDDGAELVLNGHDHNYERFAPQDPSAASDPDYGITEMVVGTGGKDLRAMSSPIDNSLAQNDDDHGVLELVLGQSGVRWRFVPVAGDSFTDSGRLDCHGEPAS